MRPHLSVVRSLILPVVALSLSTLVCLSRVSQTWAAPSQRLYRLMDWELFETEDLVCGLLPDGWTSGELLKSGKFRPTWYRVRRLKRALRLASPEEAGAVRRKLRRVRKRIRNENKLCQAAAATLAEQPDPAPVPTPQTGTTQGTDATPNGSSGGSPGGLTPVQPTPAPIPTPTVNPTPAPTPLPGTPTPTPVPTPSPLDVLNGAQIFAAKPNGIGGFEPDDAKPLGVISRDASDPNSLANPTGAYGSSDQGSVYSIFNSQAPYGSLGTTFSAFTDPIRTPTIGDGIGSPFIRKDGEVKGRLTTANPNLIILLNVNYFNTCQVLEWLGRRQDRLDACP